MEEINDIHTLSLEWGCVANLIDKISDIESSMDGGWDELAVMIADCIDEEGGEKDPSKVFFDIYQYMFRLYYRLRGNPVKREFNQISKVTISGKEVYRITNYDYKTFKWAKSGGFVDELSNDYIDLPSERLTTKQRRVFDRRRGDK